MERAGANVRASSSGEKRALAALLEVAERALDAWRGDATFVLGLCGAQGSGKSTLSEALARRLNGRGLNTAILSLDDLYLSRAARARRAREVHPLFVTRGVPGTHDVGLGVGLLDAVKAGKGVVLPRFDKSIDELEPQDRWERVGGPVDVLIFEGWCVGARAQPKAALADPVNALEAECDPDSVWRRTVNAALAEDYAALFARIDRLVMLAAPGFEVVERWRTQQEHDLRRRLDVSGEEGARVMSDAEISTFVQHYERLTRHILADMPDHADLVLRIDENRRLMA